MTDGEGKGGMVEDWIKTVADEVLVALKRHAGSPPDGRSEEAAAREFSEGIQPVWDAFTRSIRETAGRFNRSVGQELIALPSDGADTIQLRAALGSWTQTIDIRLDRHARCIVGARSEAPPGAGQSLAGVPMPTLTLHVAETPMHFDHHRMTANEAGSVVVKRLVSDLRRHLPTSLGSGG
jgi:hypothetical protein